jgi:oligo-1,6-glucosidase
MLATVLHLHRGTPYVYQGEELGMTNAPFASVDDFRDIESINHYAVAVAAGARPQHVMRGLRAKSRDNARTPMQWDAGEHAGFTAGKPWLPVNPNHVTINAAAAVADPDSIYHYYRALIDLRHTEPVIVDGDFVMLLPDDPSVYAFLRRTDEVELLVLGNFTGSNVVVALPDGAVWVTEELVLGNYPSEDAAELVLRPWETRIYRRARPSSQ